MPEIDLIRTQISVLWQRLRAMSRDQRGYSTEFVVITAALATLAIAVAAIIAAVVLRQANSVQTH
jgi:hypothetical protein